MMSRWVCAKTSYFLPVNHLGRMRWTDGASKSVTYKVQLNRQREQRGWREAARKLAGALKLVKR